MEIGIKKTFLSHPQIEDVRLGAYPERELRRFFLSVEWVTRYNISQSS